MIALRLVLASIACLALIAWAPWWGVSPMDAAPPSPEPPEGVAICLACHGQPPGLTADRDGQEHLLPAIDWAVFDTSAHGRQTCIDCHAAQSGIPHAPLAPGERLEGIAACEGCHKEPVEGYLEGPHGTMEELRDGTGPTCTECHGNAHEVRPIAAWTEEDRAEVCGGCHKGAGSNMLNALSHEPHSRATFPIAFFAGRFLVVLASGSLAFGIIHVELEFLRWLARRHEEARQGRERWVSN